MTTPAASMSTEKKTSLDSAPQKASVGILGGSFNPLHIGHIRLAIEVFEAMRPHRLDFLPAATPPHKGYKHVLPFALRTHMLEEVVKEMPHFAVNTIEGEREGPSYTVDTLKLCREREPLYRRFFILGVEDFAHIHTWYQWKEIPRLVDLLIVPRSGNEIQLFVETVRRLWPEARTASGPPPVDALFELPGAEDCGKIMYLTLPRIDIRAELIRNRFLVGRSIRFLVPDSVSALLARNAPSALCCWKPSEDA